MSHSLLVFLAVFLLARLMLRRPCLAMLAWSLHILMDIPTHASGLYRTPFLWPVSEYRFSGIWWSRAWFMILNYSLIAVACVVLFVWRPGAGKRETAGQTRAGEPEIRS